MSILVFLVAGAVMSLGAHVVIRDRAADVIDRKTDAVERLVTAEIDRYRASLEDVSAAVAVVDRLRAADFEILTAPLNAQRLPGAVAVSLIVEARGADVPAVQAHWRAAGAKDLVLQPSPVADDRHYLGVLSRPLDSGPPVTGLDAASIPEAREVLERARATHRVALSRTYHLRRDQALPASQRQLSFVLAAPVEAFGEFRGWVVMALRGADFLREVIGIAAGEQVSVTLFDAGESIIPVAAWRPAEVDTSLGARAVSIAAPQRSWRLTVEPTTGLLPPTNMGLISTAATVGLSLAALLTTLTVILVTAHHRAAREVVRATAVLQEDIRRREEIERRLRRREQELVGFAGMVAHDLRAPLTAVTGYADLLCEEGAEELSDEQRAFLGRMQAGTRRMRRLIDDLLAYATADNAAVRVADVDLGALVEEIADERRVLTGGPEPRIEVSGLPTVAGDATMLRQVFDNLIGNAIKYTPPGDRPVVRVSSAPDGPDLFRFEIADRGIGIPADQRAYVFDAFTRVTGSERYPGTGLGLAIVRRVVERHGGHVGVDANPEGGSRFWFTLPSDQVAAREPQRAA
ncbi:ATP-binding protein [Actinoplanes sp. NPDC051861]|uniref:sensor histidine kinase n=1 Tax=Actinoplanes sp. NPDC051861 TaxID=3155170 RepID=UPI00343EBDA9